MTKTDNKKYVLRGANLVIKHDEEWDTWLENVNEGKVGAPFKHASGLIMIAAALRTAFGVQYRQLAGMIMEMTNHKDTIDHTTIFRRMEKLKVDIKGDMVTVTQMQDKNRPKCILAIDSTGLKQHNRGEWIRKKWKMRRGFVKLHLLIDVKTHRIFAVSVTSEKVGDSRVLPELLNQIADELQDVSSDSKPQNMLADCTAPPAKLESNLSDTPSVHLLADRAYSSRKNVTECTKRGINPLIMHKINSTPKGKGHGSAWGDSVRHQFGGSKQERIECLSDDQKKENLRRWKSTVGYGARWNIEIAISAFKRMFGEHLMSVKWENMVKEVMLRVYLYNRWIEQGALSAG